MKSRRRPRAKKGHRPTTPAPSVEDLLGAAVDRHQAFEGGHLGALFDELTAARRAAMDKAQREELQDADPVLLPAWAFEAVASLVEADMTTGSIKRGRHAKWWRRYRDDLIQWHRYALVRQRLDTSTAGWPDNAAGLPDVYGVVSRELEGTSFAANPSGVRKSYKAVAAAISEGQHHRYYRSSAAHVYDFLLRLPRDAATEGSGASWGHLYIKSSQ